MLQELNAGQDRCFSVGDRGGSQGEGVVSLGIRSNCYMSDSTSDDCIEK